MREGGKKEVRCDENATFPTIAGQKKQRSLNVSVSLNRANSTFFMAKSCVGIWLLTVPWVSSVEERIGAVLLEESPKFYFCVKMPSFNMQILPNLQPWSPNAAVVCFHWVAWNICSDIYRQVQLIWVQLLFPHEGAESVIKGFEQARDYLSLWLMARNNFMDVAISFLWMLLNLKFEVSSYILDQNVTNRMILFLLRGLQKHLSLKL